MIFHQRSADGSRFFANVHDRNIMWLKNAV